jgi:hypothetical protein
VVWPRTKQGHVGGWRKSAGRLTRPCGSGSTAWTSSQTEVGGGSRTENGNEEARRWSPGKETGGVRMEIEISRDGNREE